MVTCTQAIGTRSKTGPRFSAYGAAASGQSQDFRAIIEHQRMRPEREFQVVRDDAQLRQCIGRPTDVRLKPTFFGRGEWCIKKTTSNNQLAARLT